MVSWSSINTLNIYIMLWKETGEETKMAKSENVEAKKKKTSNSSMICNSTSKPVTCYLSKLMRMRMVGSLYLQEAIKGDENIV